MSGSRVHEGAMVQEGRVGPETSLNELIQRVSSPSRWKWIVAAICAGGLGLAISMLFAGTHRPAPVEKSAAPTPHVESAAAPSVAKPPAPAAAIVAPPPAVAEPAAAQKGHGHHRSHSHHGHGSKGATGLAARR